MEILDEKSIMYRLYLKNFTKFAYLIHNSISLEIFVHIVQNKEYNEVLAQDKNKFSSCIIEENKELTEFVRDHHYFLFENADLSSLSVFASNQIDFI